MPLHSALCCSRLAFQCGRTIAATRFAPGLSLAGNHWPCTTLFSGYGVWTAEVNRRMFPSRRKSLGGSYSKNASLFSMPASFRRRM